MLGQPSTRNILPHGYRDSSVNRIISLALVFTFSGCAWVSPGQWFSRNDPCDPDDRSGGLTAACAKESLAVQERQSERLVCVGDNTDQAWVCGNNMEEVLALISEQDPKVLAKNKTHSSADTETLNATTVATTGAATTPPLEQINGDISAPPQLQRTIGEARPVSTSPSQGDRSNQAASLEQQSDPDGDAVAVVGVHPAASHNAQSIQSDPSETALNDVWVFGSFREKSRALMYASELERNLGKTAHLLESDPQEGSTSWYRVVMERPGTESERNLLREIIQQKGLESPWRLIVGQLDGQSALPQRSHLARPGHQRNPDDQRIGARTNEAPTEELARLTDTKQLVAEQRVEPPNDTSLLNTGNKQLAANISSKPSDQSAETETSSTSSALRRDRAANALTAIDIHSQSNIGLLEHSSRRASQSSFTSHETLIANEKVSARHRQSGAIVDVASHRAPIADAIYQQFMDINPRDFAVQLKAEKVLEDIKQYADLTALSEPTILKIKPFGSPIYVLILDTFPDFELASRAKATWIASRGDKVEPWIRTVKSLQKVIEPMDGSDI